MPTWLLTIVAAACVACLCHLETPVETLKEDAAAERVLARCGNMAGSSRHPETLFCLHYHATPARLAWPADACRHCVESCKTVNDSYGMCFDRCERACGLEGQSERKWAMVEKSD